MKQEAKELPDHCAEFPGYALGQPWKGVSRFCCKLCAYDSLDERTIRDHLIKVHQLQMCGASKKKALDVPLYDSAGRLIETREVLDGED